MSTNTSHDGLVWDGILFIHMGSYISQIPNDPLEVCEKWGCTKGKMQIGSYHKKAFIKEEAQEHLGNPHEGGKDMNFTRKT